ncbi:hypothetical protein SAMD00019534_125100 [Acytostelium subglobosum LB1]|uniref:hypothetical protein n=1 Tax=Acytostelium subglobosum LB1 TaxID=1410327 RepID=UPI0006448EAD|nr:hypothetical protein SAMD00019534_125100 [Acytostelium subglobosum LB1]GAM29334.1 hypothetical protein SAMD00019534_125100 [Acytostelium subglobosum LB1]|eukprot:XP_012747714.1 hypothetical protein SAMD00019534_125100 [Acytostelium subglobosum LB1]
MSGINKRALERDYNYSTFCQWTDDDFYEWSISLFGEHTAKVLKKQEVNAEVFCDYTEDELKALGILSGSIKKIIKFIPSIKKAMEEHMVMSDPRYTTPVKENQLVLRALAANTGRSTIPFTASPISIISELQHVGFPIFSSDCHLFTGIDYDDREGQDLFNRGDNMLDTIQDLDNNLPYQSANGRNYASHRHCLQEMYSNDVTLFNDGNIMRQQNPLIFQTLDDVTGTPFVSFSSGFRHAFKYAAGMKNYGEKLPRIGDYNGLVPVDAVLGKLLVAMLDVNYTEYNTPYNVVQAHADHLINVHNHFMNNIVSEDEVSLPGYLPGECIIMEMLVTLPDLTNEEMPAVYAPRYGLTNRTYTNFRNKMILHANNPEERRKSVRYYLDGMSVHLTNVSCHFGGQLQDMVAPYTLSHS